MFILQREVLSSSSGLYVFLKRAPGLVWDPYKVTSAYKAQQRLMAVFQALLRAQILPL